MLKLPQVTLLVADNINLDLARLALGDALAQCEFGQVLLFAHEDLLADSGHRHRYVPWSDAKKVTPEELLWRVAPIYIETSHMLNLHWDAGVLDPGCWTDEFFDYDYIGAPWWYADGRNVGNGGFSLRSARLMKHLWEKRLPVITPEDETLCRGYRRSLEISGFQWAPEALAARFAFECIPVAHKTFGFHAMRNWAHVYQGEALCKRVNLALKSDHVRRTATPDDQRLLAQLGEHLGLTALA
jgi:Protein of unknown function (DUF5672)